MINQEEWRRSAQGIFNNIIIIMLCSVLGSIFSLIGNAQDVISVAQSFTGNGNVDMGWSSMDMLEVCCSVLVVIGYVMYLSNLSAFSKVQTDEENRTAVSRIRKGLVWSIVAILTDYIAGWLAFIFSIVAFSVIIGGYSRLKHSVTFPAQARRGAGTLYASMIVELVGNILDFIPFIGDFLCMLFSFIAFCMLLRGWVKIKNANITEVSVVVSAPASVTETVATPVTEATPSVREQQVEKVKQKMNESVKHVLPKMQEVAKHPYFKPIAGGAVAVILIIGIISLFGRSSAGDLSVKLPTWQKYVTVTSNDVNLRKAPDANSPRLMREAGEMNDVFVWSDAPAGWSERKPFRLNGNVCPALSETEDWHRIYIQDSDGYDVKAYVMKKFCREVTPQPITGNKYIHEITKGKFKGKYLLYNPGGFYAEEPSISLGQKINGAYVFPNFPHPLSHAVPYVSDTYDFDQLKEDKLDEWFGEAIKKPIQTYTLYYNFGGQQLQAIKINTEFFNWEE
ncbi:MAG: hypothetical protein IJZ86_00375 [Bacteroides sp.]|nr:hypothetical protein [Bacteroides sp.]